MADFNSDEKQSKKDARREAKIEAKRRKLAEKRRERLGDTAEPEIADTAEPQAADMPAGLESDVLPDGAELNGQPETAQHDEVRSDGAQTDAGKISDQQRVVTADSSNREMRINFAEEEKARAAKGLAESGPETAESGRETGGAAGSSGRGPGRRSFSWRNLLLSGNGRGINIKDISPKFVLRCLVALLVLIFLVYAALEVADYFDKKTDVFITDEGFKHADKFERCVVINGIDVSVHQKGDINWEKVKTSGVDFVFVRAGYRAADDGSLHPDTKFEENVSAATDAGLMVGAYFYSQALNAGEGREEAEFVIDMLKGYDMTMPVAIDYELYKDGRLDKRVQAGEMYAASFYHDAVLGFTNTLEDAGYETAVYASKDMLTNYMQADLLDDIATIWLAKYGEKAELKAKYWFWQCSDKAAVGGIEGGVDHDFWYMEPGKAYKTRAKHKKEAVSVENCKIRFKDDKVKLHNFRAEPKFTVTYEDRRLAEGRDYVSSVIHNTKTGTGYVVIRGIKRYKDWIMYPFTIE